jgi:hypothetical protein
MLNEMLLIFCELLPVLNILSEVDFFGCPKGCFLVFVHLPDIAVLYREKHEAIGVLF